MILHLTLGSTHIPVEINVDGGEPQLSGVGREGLAVAAPVAAVRSKRVLPPKLTLVATGLLCGLAGYHFAPGRSGAPLTVPASAQTPRGALPAPAVAPSDIPAPLRRELARPPVVTPAAPADSGTKLTGSNPFGLE